MDAALTFIQTEEQRQELIEIVKNYKISSTVTSSETSVEKFAKQIIEKQNDKRTVFIKFLESNSVNGVIYAPTQVGKSAATSVFIQSCFKYNTPVIVSTDNKTDQQEQLYYRIEQELVGADVVMMKVTDTDFEETLKHCIVNNNRRFVIFCLDNSSQIEKLITQLSSNYIRHSQMKNIKKIAIIHDEADIITKDRDTISVSQEQPASHKKWLELRDIINKNMNSINLKRIFVTATPENVCMLYDIQCPDVMKLEIPEFYTGYDKIRHFELSDDLEINHLLKDEVKRIKKERTFESILYCVDRKVIDGHERVLKSLSEQLKCVINTYNGAGITCFLKNKTLARKFEYELRRYDIAYTKDNSFFKIKNITIRKFYTLIKKIGERCVITIGKDLISRGISYVGENQTEPITATTMFYKPGTTMHAVGICQTVGRITGCAMPNLQRRLYAHTDVYETYIKYNKNQEKYIYNIQNNNENVITKNVIEELVFNKYKRNIDRMKLNLQMTMKTTEEQEYSSEDDSEDESEEYLQERMKELIDKWWNKKTIIGKILKFVYESVSVSENELKNFIESCGSKNTSQMYIHLTRDDKDYSLVFSRNTGNTFLNDNAMDYIQTTKI